MTNDDLARIVFCAVNNCDPEDEADHISAAFAGQRYCNGSVISADDARIAALAARNALATDASPDSGEAIKPADAMRTVVEAARAQGSGFIAIEVRSIGHLATWHANEAVYRSSPAIVKEAGEVEALRALEAEATRGPWQVCPLGEDGTYWIDALDGDQPVAMIASGSPHNQDRDDAEFIVACVAHVRAALSASNAAQVSK